MATFKCKMCGGDLNIAPDNRLCICEYCGTQQTLPRLDTEKKENLYARANHFRRNNDFDKAMSLYETILNEDTSDAEAYWSIVLCRYGIEYVVDPASNKRVPTCHRTQFSSIFTDPDYKKALEFADVGQKQVYETEAGAIDKIQKDILAISQKEDPFDIFICYKETDESGKRTVDSVLAQDIYFRLVNEGYKVFFSRITLEDKLGQAYEPYIFSALNTSKVMVVVGTKPEFFNAVWVKNEWSRFLAMIKTGENKIIIPAYRDMDPYEIPEEFSHLQAQDMSRIGFMQDLLHGITKLLQKNEGPSPAPAPASTAGAEVPIIRRALLNIEDGDFEKASELLENALNMNPENAEIYVAQLLISLGIHSIDQLATHETRFVDDPYYKKALRFADPELKEKLISFDRAIVERLAQEEKQRQEEIKKRLAEEKHAQYMSLCKAQESCKTSDIFSLISGFEEMGDYEDSKERIERLRAQAYRSFCDELHRTKSISRMTRLQKSFTALGDYKDSTEKAKSLKRATTKKMSVCVSITLACALAIIISFCVYNSEGNRFARALNEGNYSTAIEIYRTSEKKEKLEAKIMKRASRIIDDYNDEVLDYNTASSDINSLLGIKQNSAILNDFNSIKASKVAFQTGVDSMNTSNYERAVSCFESVIEEDKNFKEAQKLLEEAQKLLEEARILQSQKQFQLGVNSMKTEDYSSAIKYFRCVIVEDENFAEAQKLIEEAQAGLSIQNSKRNFQRGMELMDSKDYRKAIDYFEQVIETDKNFKEAQKLIEEAQRLLDESLIKELLQNSKSHFESGMRSMDEGNYRSAIYSFSLVIEEDENFAEAQKLILMASQAAFQSGVTAMEEGDYDTAQSHFYTVIEEDENFAEAQKLFVEAQVKEDFSKGLSYMEEERYALAADYFTYAIERINRNDNFADAQKLLAEAQELLAEAQALFSEAQAKEDFSKGLSCMEKKHYDSAADYFSYTIRQINQNDNFADAQKMLAEAQAKVYFSRGLFYMEKRRYDLAPDYFTYTIEQINQNDNFADAQKLLAKAIALKAEAEALE